MVELAVYAHSVPDHPASEWERLGDHLAAVASTAAEFAAAFGCSLVAGIAGRLHDIGKCSRQFQSGASKNPTSPTRLG